MPELTTQEWRLPPIIMERVFTSFAQIIDWPVRDYGIQDVWQEYGTGSEAKVGVIDTGQPTNRDVIPNLINAKDFTNSLRGVRDGNGHSSHVNGIIAACNNDMNTVGVAPDAKLYNAKGLGDNGSGSSNGIAAAIEWLVSQGVDVISMSLGSPFPDQTIFNAIQQIPPQITLICAAGNSGPGEGTAEYPGAWDRAICVASIKQTRQVSSFSSRGQAVDIAAPGEKITSLWLDDQTATLSGTSMATPFIAGVAALAVSYCRKTGRPPMTHGLFASILEDTADDAGAPGPDTAYGFGIVNVRALLAKVKAIPPTAPPPVVPPPAPPGASSIRLSWPGPQIDPAKVQVSG